MTRYLIALVCAIVIVALADAALKTLVYAAQL